MRVRCALLRRLVRGALPAASTSLLPPSLLHSYNVHAVAATCAIAHGARYCTSTTAVVDKDESDDNDNDHTTTDAPLPLPPPLPSQQQQQQQSRFTPPPPPPPSSSSSSSSQPAAPADVDVRQFARLLRRVRNAQPRHTPADTTRTPNAAAAAAAAATDEATAAAQRAQALRCVTAVSLRHVIGLSADTLVQCLCTLAELRAPPTLTMIDDAVSWLSVHATTLRADQLAQSLYALHRLRCPQLATLVISLCDVLLYSADLTGAWDSATLLAVVWHVLGSTATNAMSITTTTTATTTTRTSAATLASSASTAVVAVLDSPVLLQLEARLRARVSHTLQYVSRMNAATLLTALAEASAAVAAATSTSTSAATAATAASLCDVAAAWATVARALRQVLCGEDANNNDDDKSSSSNSNSDSASSGGAAAAAADGHVSGGVATLPLSKVLTLATSLARIDAADSSSLAVACSALHEELVRVRAVVLADVQRRLTSGGDGGVVSEEELLQLTTLCLRGALRDEALCTAVLHTRTRTHLQRLAGARRRHGDGGSCSAASLQFVCDVLQLYMREQPHRHTTRADNSSGDDDDEVVAAAAALTTRHAMPSFLLSHIHDALDAAAAAAATTTDTTLRRAMVWPSSCVRVVLEYMCSQPAERDTALRLAHCHYTNALAPAASQPSSSTTAVTQSRLTLLPDDLTALFVDGVIDVYAAQLTPLLTAQLDRWDVAQVLAFLEHASLYYARCIAHEDEQRQLRAQQDDDDKDDGEDKDSDTTDEQQQHEQSTSSMTRSCTRHNDDDGGNSGGAAAATTATTTRQPQRGMRAVAAMLRAAAAVLAKYVERASPAQLAALMRCYGRTGVREESFCRAVVQRFVELVSELSLSQVCDVLLGLAAVEYAGDTRAFVEAAHVLCEAVARGSGSAQVVTQLLAAYATMLVWDHRLLRCLADRLVTLHETSAALVTLPQLMTAGVAMLRMDMRHDTLTRVLHARVAQLVDELSHVATTTTTMMHDSNSRAAAAAPVSSPATLLLSSSQALQLVSLLSRLPLRCDVGVFVVLAQYAAYGDDGLRPSPDVSTTPRHNNNNTDPSSSSSSSSAHGTQSPLRQQQQQQRRLRELSSDEVAELLLSLVRAGVVQHTGALFDALALRAVGLVPTASPEALVCIVDAHARAGRRDEELFASVAECVLAHNMHMAAVTIAALLSCFARAGMVHDKLFVEMIPRVRHVVHYGSVQDVVHVVYAYATVRVWHYQLFAKLAERAVQLSGDMTCAHAATLLDSFATVGMRHERLFADLAPRLVTIAAAARAREAVAIVESYARMQQRNVAVLDAYVSHLAQGIAASTVTIADAAATTGDGDVDSSDRSSSRGGGGGGCAPTLYFASDMDECASNSSGGSGLDSTAQTLTHEDVTALLEALGDLGYYHAGLAQALRPFVPLLCDAYEQQCDNAGYVDVNSDMADDGDDNDDADKVNDSDKDNNNVSNNGCGDEAEDAAARPLHSNA